MIFEKETNRQKVTLIIQYLRDIFNNLYKEDGGHWIHMEKYVIGFQDNDYFCVKDKILKSNTKLLWFYTAHIKSFEVIVENSMILINNMVAIKYDC